MSVLRLSLLAVALLLIGKPSVGADATTKDPSTDGRRTVALLPAEPAPDVESTGRVGPLELTIGQARAAAGQREGRDRLVVVARLRQVAHAATRGMTDAELIALVPGVVELAGRGATPRDVNAADRPR